MEKKYTIISDLHSLNVKLVKIFRKLREEDDKFKACLQKHERI
jgi:hypothetical protein